MPLKQETQNENKETRQHLLECAKREFLEKGYMKASLRNICKEAGVTTGALYFFFTRSTLELINITRLNGRRKI